MSTTEELARRLGRMTAADLTELLERRGLPYRGFEFGSPVAVRDLEQLAAHLIGDASTAEALAELTAPHTQILVAAALLAQRLHGPLPESTRKAGVFHGSGPWQVMVHGWDAPDPAERAVPRAALLDFLGVTGAARQAAEHRLRELTDAALVLPAPGGDPDGPVVVPHLLHRQAARLAGLGRPLDELLSRAFQSAEIQRIHRGLALPTARTRDERQQAIVDLLSRPHEVRTLVDAAPPDARELLELMTGGGPPLLRTHCFHSRYGEHYAAEEGPFVFRSGGSGDPGTDWLAERGLVVPVGHDLVELPYEIGAVLRDPDARPAYWADPPEPGPGARTGVPDPTVLREAQAAASSAASAAELLLRQVELQPLQLRKAGGVAIRETRRAAKEAGLDEAQARFWLDLAARAGLIGVLAPEPTAAAGRGRGRKPAVPATPPVLAPTDAYDRWLAAPPAERLLPLLATWAVLPDVLSWWPELDADPPVALVSPQDPEAVPLRLALLAALAALPSGTGITAGRRDAEEWLAQAAVWHRPALREDEDLDARLAATLAESRLLGVVAHGVLTPVGHAVLALLKAGAARYFPAVPGTGPSLDGHPRLATAVTSLEDTLAALLPAPARTARFQADLTAVVPGAPGGELAGLLTACADRESEGHAVVWRFSAASVRRALDAGQDADQLLSALAEFSEGGRELPQPLRYLVKDTARTHGRMRVVRSACCIRSDDETLVLELARTRSLAKLGLRRIAPTVLISTADPDTTLAALRAAGYAPVLEAETGTTVLQRPDRARAKVKALRLADAFRSPGRNGTTAPALAAELLRGSSPPR